MRSSSSLEEPWTLSMEVPVVVVVATVKMAMVVAVIVDMVVDVRMVTDAVAPVA